MHGSSNYNLLVLVSFVLVKSEKEYVVVANRCKSISVHLLYECCSLPCFCSLCFSCMFVELEVSVPASMRWCVAVMDDFLVGKYWRWALVFRLRVRLRDFLGKECRLLYQPRSGPTAGFLLLVMLGTLAVYCC